MEMKMIAAIKCMAEVCNQIGLPGFSTGYLLPAYPGDCPLVGKFVSECKCTQPRGLGQGGAERSQILYTHSPLQGKLYPNKKHWPARGYSYWSSPQTPTKRNTGFLYLKYIKNYNELLRHHALSLYHHWLSKCLKPSNTQLLFILNPL